MVPKMKTRDDAAADEARPLRADALRNRARVLEAAETVFAAEGISVPIDVIAENLLLPELRAGDLIVGRAMGAYTWASASEFNFFPKATVISVNARPFDGGSV